MTLFNEEVKKSIKEFLKDMKEEVKIIYFEKPNYETNQYYDEFLQTIEELVPKIKLEYKGKDDLVKYNVVKLPTIILEGKNKGSIRFCGLPSGHEFSTFLQDILDLSLNKTHLSKDTIKFLENLDKPLNLMVFVTAQCPYCPQAVKLAHDFAMHSDKVVAEMIMANEFPELSMKYKVQGVPHTVINEGEGEFVGAYPEDMALQEIKKLF